MSSSIQDFLVYLDQFLNHEKFLNKYTDQDSAFQLSRVAELAEKLHHPESAAKLIHVAGSKGKGSVCRMLACIIDEYIHSEVGIYASPHVYDFRERVSSSRGFLPDSVYQAAFSKLRAEASPTENPEITWFELVTMFAFLSFAEANFEYSVIETGLGGRLDATNIIRPIASIITPIELEHVNLLGNTLEKIATEKAGIIKPGVPVIVAPQQSAEICQVFRRRAKELGSPIYFVDELSQVQQNKYRDQRLEIKIFSHFSKQPIFAKLRMLGLHQAKNAATAAIAAQIIFPDITAETIARGLERAELPGRFEIRDQLILDGAHTPVSISNALETFSALFPEEKPNLLFACAADKDIEHIVPLFKNRVNQVFLTIPGEFKKSELSLVEKNFSAQGIKYISGPDYQKIISQAVADSSKNRLLAIGSFYLLDEIHKSCYNETGKL